MSLIKCPECNKEISDKAEACIYCGCPICQHQQVKEVNISSVNLKNGRKIFVRIITFFVVSTLIFSGYCVYRKSIEFESDKNIAKNCDMIKVNVLMANMYTSIIYNFWSSIIKNGVSDFNKELSNLLNKSSSKDIIKNLKQTDDAINDIDKKIRHLNYENKNFKNYVELYNAYKKLFRFSIEPSGSLLTYGQNQTILNNEYNNIIDKIRPDGTLEVKEKEFLDWLKNHKSLPNF